MEKEDVLSLFGKESMAAGNDPQKDLVFLMCEKYGMLRRRCEHIWIQEGGVKLSASEWYILSIIGRERLSAAEVARSTVITRQAAHKYIRALLDKGLLQTARLPDNRREKHVELTPLGEQCRLRCLELELELETQIAHSIGSERVQLLKEVLELDWMQTQKLPALTVVE